MFKWVMIGCFVLSATTATAADTKSMQSQMLILEQANYRLQSAFFREDWEGIAEAANTIATLKPLYNDHKKELAKGLGRDAFKFVRFDNLLRATAIRLKTGVKNRDILHVQNELEMLQDSCVWCHASYRTEIKKATGSDVAAAVEKNSVKNKMVALEQANIQLQSAFYREDWVTLAAAARVIANSVPLYRGKVMKLDKELGTEALQIARFDNLLRSTAKRLATAAEGGDTVHIQTELEMLQNSCVMCHSVYRPSIKKALDSK